MKISSLKILLVVLSVAILSSCKTKTTVTTMDASKVDKSFTIKVNEIQIIDLPSNPTTGLQWFVKDGFDTNVIENAGKEYIESTKSNALVGGGGTEEWSFKGLKKGKTYVTLEYRKESGKATEVKNYEIIVE